MKAFNRWLHWQIKFHEDKKHAPEVLARIRRERTSLEPNDEHTVALERNLGPGTDPSRSAGGVHLSSVRPPLPMLDRRLLRLH